MDKYPSPSNECIEVLKLLQKSGHKIVIYSVRSNVSESSKPNGHKEMMEYLKKYDVPFDDIDCSKPHFRMVIDDKGLGIPLDSNKNVDWTIAKQFLLKRDYI